MQLQSMHVLFGWTEWSFSKSNRHASDAITVFFLSSQTILACFEIVLWTHSSTRFVTGELVTEILIPNSCCLDSLCHCTDSNTPFSQIWRFQRLLVTQIGEMLFPKPLQNSKLGKFRTELNYAFHKGGADKKWNAPLWSSIARQRGNGCFLFI